MCSASSGVASRIVTLSIPAAIVNCNTSINPLCVRRRPLMAELNPDQNRVLETLLAGENAFVTGRAGVGKSYLVKHLCQELDKLGKSHVLLAPTGVAAINIG